MSMPILSTGAHPTPTGLPILRLAFRPFYFGAAVIAVVWTALWLAVLNGRAVLPAHVSPVLWHAHEMLFGFVVAVIVGFLLTAGKAWTGLATPRGGALGALWLLWLAGRLASIYAPAQGFAVIDAGFLFAIAVLFGRLIVRARNWRNLPIAAVLMLLGAANAVFHLAALGVVPASPLRMLWAGLALIVMLASIIGGRVIPFFTRSAVPQAEIREPRWLSPAAVGTMAAGLALWVSGVAASITVWLLPVAALLQIARMACWAPAASWRKPILWVLHVSYAWIPIGLALLAAAEGGWMPASAGVHALAVGAIGGLIIGMVTRTARGHTGRPLQASRAEVAAYALVIAAGVARVAAPAMPAAHQGAVLLFAGSAWATAFGLYLLRFAPWLSTTRLDGRDG